MPVTPTSGPSRLENATCRKTSFRRIYLEQTAPWISDSDRRGTRPRRFRFTQAAPSSRRPPLYATLPCAAQRRLVSGGAYPGRPACGHIPDGGAVTTLRHQEVHFDFLLRTLLVCAGVLTLIAPILVGLVLLAVFRITQG
jgi:hypothetical protein